MNSIKEYSQQEEVVLELDRKRKRGGDCRKGLTREGESQEGSQQKRAERTIPGGRFGKVLWQGEKDFLLQRQRLQSQ